MSDAVSSLGSVHIAPKGSKIARDEIKRVELLSHFRSAQIKHEKSGSVSGGHASEELLGRSSPKPIFGK
ncbi:hypothetical protein FRC04_000334 [Tulasnella sp. 424]|nr:hypothetical protein FRC04_000334 [Tulasnella sp. 424]